MPCVFDIISKFLVYADWKESFATIGGKTTEDKSKLFLILRYKRTKLEWCYRGIYYLLGYS